MPSSVLFPLDVIKPSEILSRYSEWIYFTLVLIFFISVAGITLRHHFNRPYVKPLIISIGFMLTVGVFMIKERIVTIFESWGALGTILLVFMAGTVPFGLCRGFGMSAGKAFYLTYVLFYIISWFKFPALYHGLAERNLGLVNLGLLIFCVFSLFKLFDFRRSADEINHGLTYSSPYRHQIEDEIRLEDTEKRLVNKEGKDRTKSEMHSVEDIGSELAGIQRIVDKSRDNLSPEERNKMARLLEEMKKRESMFRNQASRLQKSFHRMEVLDAKQLQEFRQRISKASGKEKQILKNELAREEEKIRIEKRVRDLQAKIEQTLSFFNQDIGLAIQKIREHGSPYAARPYLYNARIVLKDIHGFLNDMKVLENRLAGLINTEKRLLKKERQAL